MKVLILALAVLLTTGSAFAAAPQSCSNPLCTCNPCLCNPCTCGVKCECCAKSQIPCQDCKCNCAKGGICDCKATENGNSKKRA